MKRNIKNFIPLALPAGLVLVAWLLLQRSQSAPSTDYGILKYSSFAAFTASLFLSYWFNRSCIFYITVILAASQLLMGRLAPPGTGWPLYSHQVYTTASLLIPVNILLFSLVRERGVIWGRGKLWAFFVLGQVLLIFGAGMGETPGLVNDLSAAPFSPEFFSLTPLPQLSLIAFAATFFVLIIRLYFKPSPMDGALAGVLLASALAFHYVNSHLAVPVFFTAAGTIMTVAVLQDSYRKAYIDDLTGLPGRRALTEELEKLDGKYSIAMLDIDHFKKFNDTYGHDVGDEVLKLIAAGIRNVSGGGKPFRYGGEEFTILFPGRKISQAEHHLEELRSIIARRPFILRSDNRPPSKPKRVSPPKAPRKKVYITVSIGVSESGGRLRTAGEVVKAADEALYRAKDQGRNRVSR
ncbi:MAG TPA: GGDEF domain-containing protein [Desulfotomaculum sp.]|nr:GGDEF domain-containing protein [Desulfotomaculum sp.]